MNMKSSFILVNGNLTYDPSRPFLSSDLLVISYATTPVPPPPPPPRPRSRSAFGGGGSSGGFVRTPHEREREFAERAVVILEEKVKKTEADLFPVRTKTGPDARRLFELHALKEKVKALKKQIRDLREALKTQVALEARVKALEARLELLDESVTTVIQTGVTFESVGVINGEGGNVAVFSPADAKTVLLLSESAHHLMMEAASPEAIRILAGHSMALQGASESFHAVLGKVKTAIASQSSVQLTSVEIGTLYSFLEAAYEAQVSVPEDPSAGLRAALGIGLSALFSIFVVMASD